jgi:hypothetical protein
VQRFREAPAKLRAALRDLRRRGAACVLHLGDIIQGGATDAHSRAELELIASIFEEELVRRCAPLSGRRRQPARQRACQPAASGPAAVPHAARSLSCRSQGSSCMHTVFASEALAPLGKQGPDLPVVHVLGNHCLAVPRAELLARLRMPRTAAGGGGYYSLALPGSGASWQLVVLDTTEMSGHSGQAPGSAAALEAAAFKEAHPLGEAHPQMSDWNGGITQAQLAWLRAELAAAEASGQRVLVASHHQLGKGALWCGWVGGCWGWG